jgi:hypothetical protein
MLITFSFGLYLGFDWDVYIYLGFFQFSIYLYKNDHTFLMKQIAFSLNNERHILLHRVSGRLVQKCLYPTKNKHSLLRKGRHVEGLSVFLSVCESGTSI